MNETLPPPPLPPLSFLLFRSFLFFFFNIHSLEENTLRIILKFLVCYSIPQICANCATARGEGPGLEGGAHPRSLAAVTRARPGPMSGQFGPSLFPTLLILTISCEKKHSVRSEVKGAGAGGRVSSLPGTLGSLRQCRKSLTIITCVNDKFFKPLLFTGPWCSRSGGSQLDSHINRC